MKRTAAAGAVASLGFGRRLDAAPRESRTLLILGGTAFLGPEVVDASRARGWSVTLFNRGKTNPELFPELEKLRGDRDPKKDEGLKALEGRKWDAVVDTSGYVPRHAKASAELLRDNVKQYVFVSTISVYGSFATAGMDETAEVGKLEDASVEQVTGQTYGPLKALCEEAAEAAMPGRVTNIRPGLISGPGDPSDRYTYWPVRVARGGEVLSPGDASDPVQLIDVRDLAEFIVKTIADGTVGVYNATGPKERLTVGAMLADCKKASGSDATFTWASADFLAENGVHPWAQMPVWIPPKGEMGGLTQVSVARALAKGLSFRPHVDTARDTIAWWNAQAEERRAKMKAGLTAEREKEVLAAWHAREKKS